MSWDDFYARRDAIDAVLAYAQRHEQAALPFEDVAEARSVFADREELALALQYKWSQALMGQVAVALSEVERTPDVDHVEAVASAWRKAAARQPALRSLLDRHAGDTDASPEFHAALRAEQRMIAFAAGLAETGEPADEVARIGAAFLALIRNTPSQTRRRNPIEALFRRLVASV
jgi:hypothetical protein